MKTLRKIAFTLGMSILFGAGAAFILKYSSGRLLDRLENVAYDWRYRLKYQDVPEDERFPDYGIHIVDIDERSMDKMGSYWSWDRGYQAKMVDSLSSRFPAAIAFDVLFYDREDEKRSRRLTQILTDAVAGDTALNKYSAALSGRLAASVNYDRQFEEAIARSGRVTLGVSLAEESNYRDFTSQVSHRMDMEWHNSLSPASTLTMPDSLLARIRNVKTIIDGVYPENARAAKEVGHVNVVDASSVVRTMPFLYRFAEFQPVYLPMSIRVAATLFGTPNDEIVFKPERYIDIGKPFKIFKDEGGNARFSYPDFTAAQFRMIMAARARDERHGGLRVDALNDGQKVDVSSYAAAVRCGGGPCVETRAGRFPPELTAAFTGGLPPPWQDMEADSETEIGGGFTLRRDSDAEWEAYSDSESFWLSELDLRTLTAIGPGDLELPEGVDRKLVTFDFWIKREKDALVSPLPALRGAALAELLESGGGVIDSIPPGGRRDFGKAARIPLRRNNRHIVTYFGPKSRPFPYFSFYDVMENKVNYPMEGNVFIVGSTSPAMFDIKSAPHERVFPAVEIHASVMNSIFTGTYVRRLAEWQDLLALALVGFAVAFVAFLAKPLLSGIIAGASLFVYSFAAFQLFDSSLVWIEMVRPMIAIVLTFAAVMVYRYMTEERDKKFLHSTFKQYLSPELIDMMYTQKQKPQLGGDEGVRTAYFTDIEGFSTFSEKLGSPTRLVELLNEYLSAMTDSLLSHYGTLDKYEGDAIIAFFGAPAFMPDHAAKACRTALDMQRKLGELRGKWRGEGDKWPEIVHNMRMRIGINTGKITTGNMGSTVRMNYTMMGDAVNLAARLESAAKNYGVYTMISDNTYSEVKDIFETRKLDVVAVVGRTQPVTVYELLSEKGGLAQETRDLLEVYDAGVGLYYKQEWAAALECFVKSGGMEPNKKVNPNKPTPSSRFEKMCRAYMENPPGDGWDGVNRLTEK